MNYFAFSYLIHLIMPCQIHRSRDQLFFAKDISCRATLPMREVEGSAVDFTQQVEFATAV